MKNIYLKRRENAFEAIANIAMTNHARAKAGRYLNFKETFEDTKARLLKDLASGNPFRIITFRNPTSHPRGYLAALSLISMYTPTRAEFTKLFYGDGFKLKSVSFTLDKLRYAGLVNLNYETHRYVLTDLGRAYIAAVSEEFNVVINPALA